MLDRVAAVPGHAVADAAKAPAADREFGFQHIAHARADGQVGVADDRLGDAAGAIIARRAHRRDAVDELDLAHRRHLRGAVLAVHRAAFEEDGGDDVVPAADIGQQLGQKIAAALRRIPEMMVRVDDRQIRLQRRLARPLRQPGLQVGVVAVYRAAIFALGITDLGHVLPLRRIAQAYAAAGIQDKMGGVWLREASIARRSAPPASSNRSRIVMKTVGNCSEGFAAKRRARIQGIVLQVATSVLLCIVAISHRGWAANSTVEPLIQAASPEIETYIVNGMKTFDVPGLAVGIVADGRLVYSKGFGVRSKAGGEPVDTRTVFQIGSATKGFLSATMALMVDRGKFSWDDRVVDLDPEFQLKDPWVTREFRMFDLLAQRSGLPPYANDALGILGMSRDGLIHSLRYVEPASSFRSTFAYTNITHILAGRMVAKAAGAQDWNAVLQMEILDPLGMKETSYTAAAIEAAPNHAHGHRWVPEGAVEVPFTQIFPYDFDGAGDINSTVEDASRWLRFQLGNGTFEGRRIVSPENLTVTHTPKVAMSDKVTYAMGWVVQQTPNGTVVWHNGGTMSFGSYFGMVSEKNVGVVVLSNEVNVGLPDAIGGWVLDRILGNPKVDHVADAFKAAKGASERSAKLFAKPNNPRPFPPLTPLAGTFVGPSFGKATWPWKAIHW